MSDENTNPQERTYLPPGLPPGVKLHDSKPSTVIFVEYQPGNGTRYPLLFNFLGTLDKLSTDRIGCAEGSWLVSLCWDHPCKSMTIDTMGHVHWSYIMEKFGVSQTDALCIAEIIRAILHTS